MPPMNLETAQWRKSARSVSNGACVEVAPAHDPVTVQDADMAQNSVIVRDTVMAWVTTAGWNHEDSPPDSADEDADESAAPVAASA
jgi:hypothetical protein